MAKINVVKPFNLTLDSGKVMEFLVGEYNVAKEIAEHWFTKAHLDGFEAPPAPEGSHEWMVQASEERRAAAAEAQQKANDLAAEAAAAQEAAARASLEATRNAQIKAAEQAEIAVAKGGTVPNQQPEADLPNPLASKPVEPEAEAPDAPADETVADETASEGAVTATNDADTTTEAEAG